MSLESELTDKEKLEKVKEIIEENLFQIFTSFAIDLSTNDVAKLEKYVELKELLNITSGAINKKEAVDYDKFKVVQADRYKILMDTLEDRMLFLHQVQGAPFHHGLNISTYMFNLAFYPLFCHRVSDKMSSPDFYKMIREIEDYKFYSG